MARVELPEIDEADGETSAETLASTMVVHPHRRRRSSHGQAAEDEFLRQESIKLGLEIHHLRIRHFNELLTIGLKLITVALGVAISIAVAGMAWSAHNDHGLRVEPFSIPPDLAQRGLSGQVIAGQVLDAVAVMQAQTNSIRPADSYELNWGEDIKVEIPETGVSIGELGRWFRQTLGHETRISGEVFHTADGVAVTARVGSNPGATFAGPEAQLPDLLNKAADAVYAETQPYRHAVFMAAHGRADEAEAIYAHLAVAGSPEDRPWAYGSWSAALAHKGRPHEARERALQAVRLAPDLPYAWGVLFSADYPLSYWEEQLKAVHQNIRLTASADGQKRGGAILAGNLEAYLTGDYRALAEGVGQLQRAGSVATWNGVLPLEGADSYPLAYELSLAYAENHRPSLALQALAAIPRTGHEHYPDTPELTQALAAEDLDDGPGIVAALQPLVSTFESAGAPLRDLTRDEPLPRLAYGVALSGDPARAGALIAPTPLDCYLCLRNRGRIAVIARDWPAADCWFAAAVRTGPSIPYAYADWGGSLLARGAPDAAIRKFRAARRAGPHYADAAELWGEALLAEGHGAAAVELFQQAGHDAPGWGRNHLRWGEALLRLGRIHEARAQFRTAGALDLSTADRAELQARVTTLPHA
jgi:hypothetical protein